MDEIKCIVKQAKYNGRGEHIKIAYFARSLIKGANCICTRIKLCHPAIYDHFSTTGGVNDCSIFRLVVHKTNEEAYNKCHSLERNHIAQITGEISYRYYFESKIGMFVPYTEILVNHLHFTTSAFSARFNQNGLGPVYGKKREDTPVPIAEERVSEY